jgi:leucyl/phenylalanyl-tRNA--protein transferase
MPIFALPDEVVFPDPELSEPDGLLAVGGDLGRERLLAAYSLGIFPWYSEGQPVLWYSPDPRMLLFPNRFRKHKNLRRTVESGKFDVRFDHDFRTVIEKCALTPRKGYDGTWITEDMKDAYLDLHNAGFGHSAETYFEGKLVGGLYGLSLGGVFFGESMFHEMTDASKVALWHLVERLREWQFDFIDVQQETNHLRSLGAQPVDRRKFLLLLSKSLKRDTRKGSWES